MSDAKKLAVKFFKRNPDAKAAHVVLDRVTDDLKKANMYKKAVYAKKVSSFLREECAEELGEGNKAQGNKEVNETK